MWVLTASLGLVSAKLLPTATGNVCELTRRKFKAPFNLPKNSPRVYGPKDTAVVSPNSDTPYSLL